MTSISRASEYDMIPFALHSHFPEGESLSVKIVCAVASEVFGVHAKEFRCRVLQEREWLDSRVISNGCRRGMYDWIAHSIADDDAMTSDWDDRWRTGGNVEEVKVEAHLDPTHPWAGIERFARDRSHASRP